MNQPHAIIMIGLPATGKSTYSNNIKGYQRISTDDYIEKKASDAGSTYSAVFQKTIQAATSYNINLLDDSVNSKTDIIVDQTNITIRKRKHLVRIFRRNGYRISYKVFVLPESAEIEWKRRLSSRPGKVIPMDAINSMYCNFQTPTNNENYHDIEYINTFED
jgi:predicted kinase